MKYSATWVAQEAIDYFEASPNRRCPYLFRDNLGRKCAVGRWINPGFLIRRPEITWGAVNEWMRELDPRVRHLPVVFWSTLAGWHDVPTDSQKQKLLSLARSLDERSPVCPAPVSQAGLFPNWSQV